MYADLNKKSITFEQLHEAIRVACNQVWNEEYTIEYTNEDICFDLVNFIWESIDEEDEV